MHVMGCPANGSRQAMGGPANTKIHYNLIGNSKLPIQENKEYSQKLQYKNIITMLSHSLFP